jgi:hypothetical protein
MARAFNGVLRVRSRRDGDHTDGTGGTSSVEEGLLVSGNQQTRRRQGCGIAQLYKCATPGGWRREAQRLITRRQLAQIRLSG